MKSKIDNKYVEVSSILGGFESNKRGENKKNKDHVSLVEQVVIDQVSVVDKSRLKGLVGELMMMRKKA